MSIQERACLSPRCPKASSRPRPRPPGPALGLSATDRVPGLTAAPWPTGARPPAYEPAAPPPPPPAPPLPGKFPPVPPATVPPAAPYAGSGTPALAPAAPAVSRSSSNRLRLKIAVGAGVAPLPRHRLLRLRSADRRHGAQEPDPGAPADRDRYDQDRCLPQRHGGARLQEDQRRLVQSRARCVCVQADRYRRRLSPDPPFHRATNELLT